MATALYDPATSRTNPQATVRTGNNTANLFIGVASYYQDDLRKGIFKIRRPEHAFYFQDNFKVTPRLTLNLGLALAVHALHERGERHLHSGLQQGQPRHCVQPAARQLYARE